jgi:hypothetical protein
MRKESAQYALRVFMSYLSEQSMRAGWYSGLEYLLWAAVTTGSSHPIFVSEQERRVLEDLSNEAGGWWYYDKRWDRAGLSFVSLDEWRIIYAEKVTR